MPEELLAKLGKSKVNQIETPIDIILYCPQCHAQHIDMPESAAILHELVSMPEFEPWDNPPHRSHLCHNCGYIWRPADVPTNGVKEIKTKGKNDTPPNTTRKIQSFISNERYTKEELQLIKEYILTGRNLAEIGFKSYIDDTETIVIQRVL